MTLIDKQHWFAVLLSKLILELTTRNYQVTFGECWRSPETAQLMAKEGKGIANSLHTLRLACDLNLFRDGKLLTTKDDYAEAGKIWKSYAQDDLQTRWGGDFDTKYQDPYHFSISHEGRA